MERAEVLCSLSHFLASQDWRMLATDSISAVKLAARRLLPPQFSLWPHSTENSQAADEVRLTRSGILCSTQP
jgi:hypothetical protein